jgi:hypothetical protein
MQDYARKQNTTTLHFTSLFTERGSHFLQDQPSLRKVEISPSCLEKL